MNELIKKNKTLIDEMIRNGNTIANYEELFGELGYDRKALEKSLQIIIASKTIENEDLTIEEQSKLIHQIIK